MSQSFSPDRRVVLAADAAVTGPVSELTPEEREAIAAGMPASTSRAYAGAVRSFIRWCDGHGHPGLPTDARVLTKYARWMSDVQGLTPATIEQARWAILKWHEVSGFPLPSTVGLVAVLKGYRARLAKAKDPKAHPRKAKAASGDVLAAMAATLDRSTLAGKRDAAILLIGFAIAGRRGEIASLDIESLAIEDRGMQVDVYRQKTRKQDDPVVHRRPNTAMCPVAAAEDLIAALGRDSGPLFVRISRHGHPAHPMTRDGKPIGDPSGRLSGQAVAQVIHRCAIRAGLTGQWTGHSLRRGLATAMHEAGHEREQIERQGGWTPGSRAVSGYIDDAERWVHDVLRGVL